MNQLGLFDAPPAPPPPPPRALAPRPAAPVVAKPKRGKREPEPVSPPCVIAEPQLPPEGALAKIGPRWHRWRGRVGVCGEAMGWEPLKPREHAAHASDSAPRLNGKGEIAEPYPAPAIVHMDGHTLRIQWSEYGFAIYHGERHLLHFSEIAACAVGAATVARASEHFQQLLAAITPDPNDDNEPGPEPRAPGPEPDLAPVAEQPQRSHHFERGKAARDEGRPRQLPGYFLEPERDPKWKASRERGKRDWFDGWDAGADPAPVGPNDWPIGVDGLDGGAGGNTSALAFLNECKAKMDDATRGRFVAQLRARLAAKREISDHYSKKERAEASKRTLDRTDVRRAYRIVCPRPLAALAEDAWKVADEYDRLCRSGADQERQRALSLALDELMIEANGCDRCGVRVYPGPKQLMKALRVRARAEGRAPMWGVRCVYRFEWRGLTMISETGGGFWLRLDTDRHGIGTLCHSSSGYRSMHPLDEPANALGAPEDYARRALDAYVDGSTKHGMGLGGKLERYLPWWVSEWARAVESQREATPKYRAEYPAMMDEAKRAEYWAHRDQEWAEQIPTAEAKARALGVDLGALFPKLGPPPQASLL